MKMKPLGFWRRFLAVFTPTFLLKLNQDKTHGKSWGFWFLSNLFLVIIPFIILSIGACILLSAFPDNAIERIPADITFETPEGETYNVKELVQNFQLTFNEEFELETTNLPDPLIFSASEEDEEVTFVNDLSEISSDKANFVFVLDTKERNTSLDSIDSFQNAIYILHDKFVTVDNNDGNIEIIRYADTIGGAKNVEFPYTFNLNTIAENTPIISKAVFIAIGVFFILAYLFLAVFRLVSALFWALTFWAIGMIVKIKDWDFEKSFMAMLHFSFVTLLLFPLGLIVGLSMFWSALIILVLLFGANFYEMKKKA